MFFDLPFWQQFLVLAIVFIPVDFFICLLLETDPLASILSLSEGAGFATVGVLELIAGIIGTLFGYHILWCPFVGFILMFVGFILMVFVLIVIGVSIQAIQRAMAKLLGLDA